MAIGGWLLAVAGRWKRGLALVEDQLDVLRFSPGWLPHVFFLDAYGRGDHEKALGHALGFEHPGLAWGPVERCAALARLGRVADARGALEQAVKIRPDLLENPRRFLDCYILDDDVVEDMTGALSLAGLRS